MIKKLKEVGSKCPKPCPKPCSISISIITLLIGTAVLACAVFNGRTHLTSCKEAMIGLFFWALCLVVVFVCKPVEDPDWKSLCYLLAVISPTLLIFIFLSLEGRCRGLQRGAFMSAVAAGSYEEVFIRIMPLSLILLGLVPYRKSLMFSSSIIFGLAHVIHFDYKWCFIWVWSSQWIGNFILKALISALFGLIMAIVIVKAGKWGVLLVPIVHFFNDLLIYFFSAPAGSAIYLQGDNRPSYVFQILVTVFVMVIIELVRHSHNCSDLCKHFGFIPIK